MQLERLTLTDVGTYSGYQEFILTPRIKYQSRRPIVLFGGLNGSGKTTFLTAVRLALYGRMALEGGTTQKQYEHFLRELIHRPKHSLLRPSKGFITLEFTYAKLGEKTRFRIVRSWEARGKDGADEKLGIYRNDEVVPFLQDDQAQSFLTQLIPTGVSQFFFFDGEKISALAKDDTDVVLADSIRRLLGLDLIERLDSDLSVYLRQRRSSRVDAKTRDEIAKLQSELDEFDRAVILGLQELEQVIEPALNEARQTYERRHAELSDRGGAWAVDRNALESELDRLSEERKTFEHVLSEELNGIAVFSLAPKLASRVVASLKAKQEHLEREIVAKSIQKQVTDLTKRIKEVLTPDVDIKTVSKCIADWADELIALSPAETNIVDHGLVASESRAVIEAFTLQAMMAAKDLKATHTRAEQIAIQEDRIQEKLATAPTEESIKDALAALSAASETVGRLTHERKALIEELRRKTWLSIDLVRKLKKLESRVVEEDTSDLSERNASKLQTMLEDFKIVAAKDKCETLRIHFLESFLRLARKEDIIHDVKISPKDFTATLYDQSGHEIPKRRLSAGEKQIYAIAMLEALGKTSGRNLPVIIDTPLGRLDSKHRTKLVESYFPVASHQVIVLSTDTEVDLPFYTGLQKHISHAYHLAFDPSLGATQKELGYFWKHGQEIADAA